MSSSNGNPDRAHERIDGLVRDMGEMRADIARHDTTIRRVVRSEEKVADSVETLSRDVDKLSNSVDRLAEIVEAGRAIVRGVVFKVLAGAAGGTFIVQILNTLF